jgi:hypothetical protein
MCRRKDSARDQTGRVEGMKFMMHRRSKELKKIFNATLNGEKYRSARRSFIKLCFCAGDYARKIIYSIIVLQIPLAVHEIFPLSEL